MAVAERFSHNGKVCVAASVDVWTEK
jgi:hypothetical protein